MYTCKFALEYMYLKFEYFLIYIEEGIMYNRTRTIEFAFCYWWTIHNDQYLPKWFNSTTSIFPRICPSWTNAVIHVNIGKTKKPSTISHTLCETSTSVIICKCFSKTRNHWTGYYQIPVAESSHQYRTLVTHDGNYKFKRMPFRLVNGPAVF